MRVIDRIASDAIGFASCLSATRHGSREALLGSACVMLKL
jgi:hypothetical protein